MGVPVDVFTQNCPQLLNSSTFAKDRIMRALGVDTCDKQAIVTFDMYLQLCSNLSIGTVNKSAQRIFAVKLFDPCWLGQLSYDQFLQLMTQIFSNQEPGASSYAASVVNNLVEKRYMSREGCVDPNKLVDAIVNNIIELEVLLNAIQ